MTASTEQFADFAKRGQDLVTESVRTWTDAVQAFTQIPGSAVPQLPDAGATVDRVFDFYEQVLGQQREFVKTVVGAGTSVVDQFTEQATKAAEAVTEQATQAADKAESAQKPARTTRSAAK
ncbi:hypothetical protein H7X46_10485 [Pseudonocardia sp. C8]|uniref:hypothetical protein n=1 Tax=Pseudonocardia sp. C8 TaxID=2762759 RepID=UPI0016427CB8|nr:hypothetical protein [Pseudonocardia sp. C8]MBC3191488.1 hypothetical protein [Pseudonocardia sp. C8]